MLHWEAVMRGVEAGAYEGGFLLYSVRGVSVGGEGGCSCGEERKRRKEKEMGREEDRTSG
jgi:hypothetical protein